MIKEPEKIYKVYATNLSKKRHERDPLVKASSVTTADYDIAEKAYDWYLNKMKELAKKEQLNIRIIWNFHTKPDNKKGKIKSSEFFFDSPEEG